MGPLTIALRSLAVALTVALALRALAVALAVAVALRALAVALRAQKCSRKPQEGLKRAPRRRDLGGLGLSWGSRTS